MDSDPEEAEVFSDTEDTVPLRVEEEEEGDEEDAQTISAWMERYRGGGRQRKAGKDEEEEGDSEGARAENRPSSEVPAPMRAARRASLPCPVRNQNQL